ncbi:hypothetical protein H6G04_07520 [Calothrix membranacea FACHB-236]|nr:hypothetical protein [Calothrix membranacea FACHB-236]
MNTKTETIEALLEGLSVMERFYEPPEVIFKHFSNWLISVSKIFDSTNMNDELNIWNQALIGIRFSDDSSLVLVMSIAKATLLSILHKLGNSELIDTPYLNQEDISNAYKMSNLYVMLHCYENSVRRFIEQVYFKEYGDNWWEKVGNSEMNTKITKRKKQEETNKWLSPRSNNSPLYYIDWGDLATLIRKNETIFLPYIGTIKFIDNRFQELESLRNIIAHNGVIYSEDDFQRIIISFRDWCRQIRIQ